MKKVVCADEVKAVAEKGQKVFCVGTNTIITPAAKDLAKELGVEFAADAITATGNHICKNNLGKSIDRDVIYQIVKALLANNYLDSVSGSSFEPPFRADSEPKSGLKIVRGRKVKYQPFDTGDPSTNVAYREVVSKDNSQMTAGFLTIEKSSFDWELSYGETDIILEGSLSITINGETFEACQGDVVFIPKGSKVTRGTSGYVKLFYATTMIGG